MSSSKEASPWYSFITRAKLDKTSPEAHITTAKADNGYIVNANHRRNLMNSSNPDTVGSVEVTRATSLLHPLSSVDTHIPTLAY